MYKKVLKIEKTGLYDIRALQNSLNKNIQGYGDIINRFATVLNQWKKAIIFPSKSMT